MKNTDHIHIVILGGGFSGVGVLKNLQNEFDHNNNVEITMISKNNFLLFTPMLPEIVSGSIETRHIVTPLRSFCNKATFYEAEVKSIDLDNKQIAMIHTIGREPQTSNAEEKEGHVHKLRYDYLVIALGSENNFFGNSNIQENTFTLKTITDAILLRNHLIKVLEQASIEQDDKELRKSLLTFVVVGGGFSGVETVGAVNDFIRESVKLYYPNIYMSDVKVVLVSATNNLLEQIDEDLGRYALEKLKVNGVEFIMDTLVKDVAEDKAILNDDTVMPCYTLIWTAGVTPNKLITDLNCKHDENHRIITNNHLEVNNYENSVYSLGDCASITNPHTGKPYPPTAQHAIKQSEVVSKNIISLIKGKPEKDKQIFDYKSKGMMAQIGKRTGVAIFFSKIKLHGFLAWWLWRMYYLINLPTTKKKIKVIGDWTFDFIFKPDVSQIQ
ncbi:MAG: NAD(P)/FAD-dependent oxidoreductase [Candidatus Nitrosocosmicus sp.]|nr:NAD(P)/FAD-dependent oxidoreductase [Candidatus Nitrosocosmicus sp.]MDN5866848.1 NAD(P)/FAD-dependent oxidoreductase [Candidatus Nitrosocosmicus sp.]